MSKRNMSQWLDCPRIRFSVMKPSAPAKENVPTYLLCISVSGCLFELPNANLDMGSAR